MVKNGFENKFKKTREGMKIYVKKLVKKGIEKIFLKNLLLSDKKDIEKNIIKRSPIICQKGIDKIITK